jgi:hypothetical protein
VASRSGSPHGMIDENADKSVETFKARPWRVYPPETATPIAPSFLSSTQTPVFPQILPYKQRITK